MFHLYFKEQAILLLKEQSQWEKDFAKRDAEWKLSMISLLQQAKVKQTKTVTCEDTGDFDNIMHNELSKVKVEKTTKRKPVDLSDF